MGEKMLRVSFWSSFRGKGVTSNMLAIALATSRYFRVSIGVRSNHISRNMLDYYLSQVDHRVEIVASDTECYSRDLPQYLHYLLEYDQGFQTKMDMRRVIAGKKEAQVCLYRPPEPFEKDIYPQNGEDMMFLDISGKNNIDGQEAMEMADINVIFLPVDIEEIRSHFMDYPVSIKKTLYVINGISEKSDLSPKMLRNALWEEFGVRKSCVWFIPYYERLRRASHLGQVDLMMLDEEKQRLRTLYYKSVKEIGKQLLKYKGRL